MKYTLCDGAYANVQILLKVKGNLILKVQCLEFQSIFWKKMNAFIFVSICSVIPPKYVYILRTNPKHWTDLMGIQLFCDFYLRAIIVCVRLRIGGLSRQVKEPSLEYGPLPSLPHPVPGCTHLFQRQNVKSSRSLSRINRSILISESIEAHLSDLSWFEMPFLWDTTANLYTRI